jgi:Proline dehydrogenase
MLCDVHPAMFLDSISCLAVLLSRALSLPFTVSQVQLMIDAEHTYFQPAIDHFVLNLQCKHNVDRPLIFNTYQCYLTHSYRHLCDDLKRSERFGWWSCACVRACVSV